MRKRIPSRGAGVCADKGTTASRESSTPKPSWLCLKEASKYADVCPRTLRRHAISGRLKHGKYGRSLRFKASDIDAWLRKGAAS
jgi:excisionase family DNA binding protein